MTSNAHWPTTRVSLLAKIRDAKSDAWELFVDLYAPVVYAYCRRRRLQDADAQNVVQEVFWKVSRAIDGFKYDEHRGRFRGWLGLITHQQIIRHWENCERAERGLGGGMGDALCDTYDRESEGEWVETFNSHIYAHAASRIRIEFDFDTWNVFERIWEQGESPRAAAEAIGRTTAFAYQAKHKVVQRLRREVERLTHDAAFLHR